MKQVRKYTLGFRTYRNEIILPENAEIIAVKEQYGEIRFWCLIDPSVPEEMRMFEIYHTDEDINCESWETYTHVATCIDEVDYHVFEVKYTTNKNKE